MAKWWDADHEPAGKTATELELEHVRRGRNIVSLSAARYRRHWNNNLHLLNGTDDDHAA